MFHKVTTEKEIQKRIKLESKLFGEHFLIYNFFPLKSLYKENILTNQMKNEYFQENLEKRIKITRETILSEVPNDIFERKSKSEGK